MINRTVEHYRDILHDRLQAIATAHDESGHFYIDLAVNNPRYPSVSSKLKILDDTQRDYLMNRAISVFQEHHQTKSGVPFENIVEQARNAAKVEMAGAGGIGSAVHYGRELYFKEWISDSKRPDKTVQSIQYLLDSPYNTSPDVTAGLRAVEAFLNQTKPVPVATEIKMVSHRYHVGGTLDDLMMIPDRVTQKPKLWLIDFKTSSEIRKKSMAAQLAIYSLLLYEITGIKVQGVAEVWLDKETGRFYFLNLGDPTKLRKAAVSHLQYLEQTYKFFTEVVEPVPVILNL